MKFTTGFPVITALNEHLLKGVEFSAHVQGHLPVFIGCVGIGSVLQQQLGALRLALLTGLMQGSGAPRCQVHSSAPQEEMPQTFGETPASGDVQWRGQLLFIRQ